MLDINISSILSPVIIEKEEHKHSELIDTTLFATPPSNKSRGTDVQTFVQSPSPPPIEERSEPPLPPYVDMIFSHMNGVNQWINKFCADSELIQNDINTIRVHIFFLIIKNFKKSISILIGSS